MPPAAAPAPSAAPSAAPRRRALLVGLTLALPWLLLALAEGGLRAAGVGGDDPLFVPYDAQPAYRLSNPDAARRYFRGAFVPTPHTSFFRAEKPAGAFRVVFQGESSAQGFPYLHGGAPSRMVERWLQAAFPGREIEFVNTAFTAVSSHVVLDQADAVLAARPDAVLIYTGHNEYYGVYGAAAAGALRRPALVRGYLALRRLRLVQLAERALGGGGAAPNAAAAGGDAPRSVMALMAGDQQVPLGSQRFDDGVAQFRDNLGRLLARYRAAGVPAFVGTLVSNERDQPPLDGAPAARAHYDRARALEARGDTAAARGAYRAAKEADALRFRAPEAMNAVIREQCARHGATVVETQAAVAAASPGGVPGAELILEHLHPNVRGYAVIARAFHDALRARGLPAAWPAGAPAPSLDDVPVTAVDSAVGALRTDRLRSGWPFQPRGRVVVPAVDTLTPRTPAEAFAKALVLGQTPWAAATDGLREAYEQAGDTARAIAVARVMAQEFRHSPQPWLDAARLALAQGRDAEALDYARRANARRGTPEGLALVARLGPAAALRTRGERALPLLEARRRALAGPPAARDSALLYQLAVAYALTGDWARAREALGVLRRVAPGHAGAADLAARVPPG
jgi:lysophospholipase L1-like esterase